MLRPLPPPVRLQQSQQMRSRASSPLCSVFLFCEFCWFCRSSFCDPRSNTQYEKHKIYFLFHSFQPESLVEKMKKREEAEKNVKQPFFFRQQNFYVFYNALKTFFSALPRLWPRWGWECEKGETKKNWRTLHHTNIKRLTPPEPITVKQLFSSSSFCGWAWREDEAEYKKYSGDAQNFPFSHNLVV